MLDIEGVAKRFGRNVALDGVSMAVGDGEICAVLGPNGAGKTTLVSTVAGLARPDTGQVRVDGVDVWPNPRAVALRVGLAPQELGVYPTLTARDNLKFFGELYGLASRALAVEIDRVADILDLGRFLDTKVRHLSGGEQRRVHTAMAMLHRPPLLLLDEPTVGVDVGTRVQLLAAVRALAAEGTTTCYSTHYLAEVESLGARVVILDRGRIAVEGTVDDLVRAHGTSAVELELDGEPLPAIRGAVPTGDPGVLRIADPDPTAAIAGIFDALGPDAARVRQVNIARADLESVFLAVTGRRFQSEDPGDGASPAELAVG